MGASDAKFLPPSDNNKKAVSNKIRIFFRYNLEIKTRYKNRFTKPSWHGDAHKRSQEGQRLLVDVKSKFQFIIIGLQRFIIRLLTLGRRHWLVDRRSSRL